MTTTANTKYIWKFQNVNTFIILALIAAFGASVDGTRYGVASMTS